MTKTKRIIAVALAGTMLLPAINAANAGPRDGWNRNGYSDHRGPDRPRYYKKQHNNHGKKHNKGMDAGAAVAAGIFGLAAGAIIAGAVSQPSRPAPAPSYSYGGTPGYQPWSPAWYNYCSSKYRSFNPSTGTYTTYSGEQKFCQ